VRDYLTALHGMQAGVALDIERAGVDGAGANPKHLRVGINSGAVTAAAIAGLLIAKGVFTMEEYQEALTKEANAEVERYEQLLSSALGTKVTLH
jgi:hypothetical protein